MESFPLITRPPLRKADAPGLTMSPSGTAAATILMAFVPGTQIRADGGRGRLFFILNRLAMPVTHVIVRWLGPLLRLLGVVPGLNKVALGLQLMIGGLSDVIGQSDLAGWRHAPRPLPIVSHNFE